MTHRTWVFTIFQTNQIPSPDQAPVWNPAKMKALVYQWEVCPQSGRLHLQGCIKLTQAMRLPGVKALLGHPQAHVEPCADWRASVAYCQKESTRAPGTATVVNGEVNGCQGKRTDLLEATTAIKRGRPLCEVAEEFPGTYVRCHKGLAALKSALTRPKRVPNRRVVLLWGTSGSGKTRMAHELFESLYTVFDIKTPWFDGYDNEDVALFDECGKGMMNINYLKRLLDIYPMSVPVKGGSVAWNPTTIILTSNIPLHLWYDNYNHEDFEALSRRIKIFKFPDEMAEARAYLQPPPIAPSVAISEPEVVGGQARSVSDGDSDIGSLAALSRQDALDTWGLFD